MSFLYSLNFQRLSFHIKMSTNWVKLFFSVVCIYLLLLYLGVCVFAMYVIERSEPVDMNATMNTE